MRSLESFFKNICVLMSCFVIRNSNVPEGRDQRHRAQKGAWIYDPPVWRVGNRAVCKLQP